ncbi:hypothetical protein M569_00285, partial [Genlisea aurea]
LLIINGLLLAVGSSGIPLIMRLYFIHGGKMLWFASWLQTSAFPLILIPLLFNHLRRTTTTAARFFSINRKLSAAAAAIGIAIGFNNYLYAYGSSKLPVSTSSLIFSTQLIFTALFSFLLVKHKFTAYSINAIVLLTVGAVILSFHSSAKDESDRDYEFGFAVTVTAVALSGLIQPLMELCYLKSDQAVDGVVALEFQFVLSSFATGFCTVGMLMGKDFEGISGEAKGFEIGAVNYILTVFFTAVVSQCFFLGSVGVIHLSSALLAGVIICASLPLCEILAVVLFREKFRPEKGVSLLLSLWGSVSYFYGEF